MKKIKTWFKKHWFPMIMNFTFFLQFGTGYLAEEKINYYIVLSSMIILWNMMYFISMPLAKRTGYLDGKLDAMREDAMRKFQENYKKIMKEKEKIG